MVLVQNWPVFEHYFGLNIGQENESYDILKRRNAFLGYKKKEFKKLKNCHLSKGVSPWFWPEIGHFSKFIGGIIGQENVFCDILKPRNGFLGHKNKKFIKWKN